MAAVTVDSEKNAVFGNYRAIMAQVDIANDADTWDTNLSQIYFVGATSATNAAIGATLSGGTITFQTGGAESNVQVLVLGN